jgi:hypothetical protein
MQSTGASALITDQGERVLLRIQGRIFELTQLDLREVLGLPTGPPGLGTTVDRDRFRFEFVEDGRTVELSAAQLRRRIGRAKMPR